MCPLGLYLHAIGDTYICTLPMTLMVSVSLMIEICDPYVYVPLGSSLVHIGVMTLMVTLQ